MKKNISIILFIFLFGNLVYAQDPFENFDYLDPLPNAKYINASTTIIIRPKENIDINTITEPGSITIISSLSGNRNFTSKISDNNKIVILNIDQFFPLGDVVTINFSSVIKKKDGSHIRQFHYSFKITTTNINKDFINTFFDIDPYFDNYSGKLPTSLFSYGLPEIKVTYSHFPSPGKLFFSNLVRTPAEENTPYLLIVGNDGTPVFKREMPGECYDFNIQPNGLLTYYDQITDRFYGMNRNYEITDTFYCGNGYTADLHDLRILPNGHYLIMSYDPRNIDSIGIEPDFHTAAASRVIGIIIQELDRNKDVVFQWRSWDYFKISDATHENLGATTIDYCHTNAIEQDNDGNILISSRNMDEITKINRITGRIIWRFGGKNNQFNFLNDTIGFSHQHAIRRIKNGNLTLFDNGNFHNPPFSRAVEYQIDEVNKTAKLVWQYRNNPDIYAPATGYVQRLPNNNTLICWGLTNPTLAEVRYDGTKVLEMTLPPGVFSYRAYRYEWNENPNSDILPSNYSLIQNYPNPFNPSTTIKFTIPELESEASLKNVKLQVYNITGKLVRTLVNENFPAGTYSVNFNASDLSSGVYFYKIEIEGFSETKKMILVK